MLIKLSNVRLSFNALFTPEAYKAGDEEKFKAVFLIEKGSDLDKRIQQGMLDVAKLKFGEKNAQRVLDSIRVNPNKCCYQDGDTRDYDGYEGHMALTAKNASRPLVLDRDKTPLNAQDGKPYSGCYVNAQIELFGYTEGGKGISASLGGVQFVRDGDKFGGGTRVTEDHFDDLGDFGDDEDGDGFA